MELQGYSARAAVAGAKRPFSFIYFFVCSLRVAKHLKSITGVVMCAKSQSGGRSAHSSPGNRHPGGVGEWFVPRLHPAFLVSTVFGVRVTAVVKLCTAPLNLDDKKSVKAEVQQRLWPKYGFATPPATTMEEARPMWDLFYLCKEMHVGTSIDFREVSNEVGINNNM
jgi:hypothetical protein